MLGSLTVVDDEASVGPVKFTRVALVGDSSYPTGGSPGFLAALNDAVGEDRTAIAVVPQGVNGGLMPEYTPPGNPEIVSVDLTGLFTCLSPVDPRTGLGGAPVAHGLVVGQPVYLQASNLGNANRPNPRLPAGFAADTLYYVISSGFSSTQFRLSATSGGGAIAPTDVGAGLYEVFASDRLLVRVSSTGNEEANTTNLSGSTFNLLAITR